VDTKSDAAADPTVIFEKVYCTLEIKNDTNCLGSDYESSDNQLTTI
jgi:hypothetical protein